MVCQDLTKRIEIFHDLDKSYLLPSRSEGLRKTQRKKSPDKKIQHMKIQHSILQNVSAPHIKMS